MDGFTYTVNETDPATFTCLATGIPPPEITWMRNGAVQNESVDSRISLGNPSDPETVPTPGGNIFSISRNLTLNNTMDPDSGTYTCVASNAAANATQDFELVVQGEKVFACVYIYQKVDAGERGFYNLEPHTTQPLNFMPKTVIKLLLLLISTVAPQILDPPDDLIVVEPQDATFTCLATGRPRPTIVWTRLSDMLQLQNQSGVHRIQEQEIGDRERRSNLTIFGSQPSDAGGYACVAMNEPGTYREEATLTVHGEPHH